MLRYSFNQLQGGEKKNNRGLNSPAFGKTSPSLPEASSAIPPSESKGSIQRSKITASDSDLSITPNKPPGKHTEVGKKMGWLGWKPTVKNSFTHTPCLPAGKTLDEFKPKATEGADVVKYAAAKHRSAITTRLLPSAPGWRRESSAMGQSNGESREEPDGDSSTSSCSSGSWALPDLILFIEGVVGPSCSLPKGAKPHPSGIYRDSSKTAELGVHVNCSACPRLAPCMRVCSHDRRCLCILGPSQGNTYIKACRPLSSQVNTYRLQSPALKDRVFMVWSRCGCYSALSDRVRSERISLRRY